MKIKVSQAIVKDFFFKEAPAYKRGVGRSVQPRYE